MILTFRDCELDTTRFVLRRAGQPCPVEPLVFNLLVYLLQQRDRVVLRQELLEALWPGKVVSESALSSCVKAARQAVGDSGETQTCIATVHGRGYRFVASVGTGPSGQASATATSLVLSAPPATPQPNDTVRSRRASIAVMPFADLAAGNAGPGSTAGALAHDVITRLAQLRGLFVIAQGTVFALNARDIDPRAAGRLLDVDYVASGTVRRHGALVTVTAELVDSSSGRIVWSEIFEGRHRDTLDVLDEIGNKIVACIANEIEALERNRALLKPPNSLDAWEAHHRGLWHMYRFNRDDNAQAEQFFSRAVQLDPTFARAWAGLSFTHFQSAFQEWAPREEEIERAFRAAAQSLSMDERSPAAHWAMGRALWLRGRHAQAIDALHQSVELGPSFAQAHYTLAFIQAQAGDPQAAIAAADHSRLLSPYDPLLFGMLGARAIALVRLQRFEEAARWAVQAAAQPNAHVHIHSMAAFTLALAGALSEARQYAATVRQDVPDYDAARFHATFHMDAQGRALFAQGARLLDMA
jgi:TolB-like protein/Flp pilus assembly protein TadD